MAWTAPASPGSVVLTNSFWSAQVRDNMLETAPAKVTTAGDLVYATAANALARLAIGTAPALMQVASGAPAWLSSGGALEIPRVNSGATAIEFVAPNVALQGYELFEAANISAVSTIGVTSIGGARRARMIIYATGASSGAVTCRFENDTSGNYAWSYSRNAVNTNNTGQTSIPLLPTQGGSNIGQIFIVLDWGNLASGSDSTHCAWIAGQLDGSSNVYAVHGGGVLTNNDTGINDIDITFPGNVTGHYAVLTNNDA